MRIILAAFITLLIAMLTHLPVYAANQEVPACQIASEGIFNGFWMKHRIFIQENTVFGANDMDSILSELESLRDEGLCR